MNFYLIVYLINIYQYYKDLIICPYGRLYLYLANNSYLTFKIYKMKQKVKKLSLNKTTVAKLTESDMNSLKGGTGDLYSVLVVTAAGLTFDLLDEDQPKGEKAAKKAQ